MRTEGLPPPSEMGPETVPARRGSATRRLPTGPAGPGSLSVWPPLRRAARCWSSRLGGVPARRREDARHRNGRAAAVGVGRRSPDGAARERGSIPGPEGTLTGSRPWRLPDALPLEACDRGHAPARSGAPPGDSHLRTKERGPPEAEFHAFDGDPAANARKPTRPAPARSSRSRRGRPSGQRPSGWRARRTRRPVREFASVRVVEPVIEGGEDVAGHRGHRPGCPACPGRPAGRRPQPGGLPATAAPTSLLRPRTETTIGGVSPRRPRSRGSGRRRLSRNGFSCRRRGAAGSETRGSAARA